MNNLFNELKRRNVVKVGIAYLALAWFVIQITSLAVPAFNFPDIINGIVFYLGLVGFPFALFFAWAFEMTPEGIKRTENIDLEHSITQQTGTKIEHVTVGLLACAVVFMLWDNYGRGPSSDAAAAVQAPVKIMQNSTPSVAVLPFVNMSADEDQEYFSDGISEEILNVLAKLPNLHVTSRSSSFAFKGKDLDLTKVAAQLGVDHILEGSVRKSGTKVRITAQLIEAGTDRHLWSETYDRELVDVFAVQDELSAAIVAVLKVKLLGDDSAASISAPLKVNAEAYTAYLKGVHFRKNGTTMQDVYTAREFFEQSIALDPSFAPAHANLAGTLSNLTGMAYIPLSEGAPLARASAERAIALDANYASGYVQLANVKSQFDFDFIGAVDDLEHAIQLNPNDVLANTRLSSYSSMLGKHDLALAQARKAVALDPVNAFTLSRVSRAFFYAGRYSEAQKEIKNALTLSPNNQGLLLFNAYVELMLGKYSDALTLANMLEDEAYRPQIMSMAHFGLGDETASDKALATLIKDAAVDSAFQVAEVYCYRGENAECLNWLDISYKQKDPGLGAVTMTPFLRSVHSEPSFKALVDRMGLSDIIKN